MIPIIDVQPLFAADPHCAADTDRALLEVARDTGFACIQGLPADIPFGSAARAALLAIFQLSDVAKRRLYRRRFSPENCNVYRGYFPVQPGNLTCKEGIDIGGDLAHGPSLISSGDPLREASPVPHDSELPGWRAAAVAYYLAMECVASCLMRSLARSLGLSASYFDDAFRQGLSTLRLIRYPARSPAEFSAMVGAAHTDSGFVTLLAQDRVAGLQARARTGRWTDVPPLEGTLVVNFGQVLELWSAGRIRATEHRVLGTGVERYSIAFFYEARADAIIAPLPIDAPDRFAPFQYGDFLWRRMTTFVEFRGMEAERNPRGPSIRS